jgi:hypothetical protein
LAFITGDLDKLGIDGYDINTSFDFNASIGKSSKRLQEVKILAKESEFELTSRLTDFKTKVGFRCLKTGSEFSISPAAVIYWHSLSKRRKKIDAKHAASGRCYAQEDGEKC